VGLFPSRDLGGVILRSVCANIVSQKIFDKHSISDISDESDASLYLDVVIVFWLFKMLRLQVVEIFFNSVLLYP